MGALETNGLGNEKGSLAFGVSNSVSEQNHSDLFNNYRRRSVVEDTVDEEILKFHQIWLRTLTGVEY